MRTNRFGASGSLWSLVLCAACGSSSGSSAPDASAGGGDAGPDASVAATDAGPSNADTGLAVDGASPDTGGRSPEAGGAPEAGGSAESGSPEGAAPLPEAGGDGGALKYDQDGPLAVTTSTAMVTNGADTFTETIYVPSSTGMHPVVSLSPGLQQPAAAYVPYAQRLASYGIVVLVRDDPGLFTQSQVIAADVAYVVSTWLPAQNADPTSALHGQVNLMNVGLSGHSRGGAATLLAAEGALKGHVVAWFGIDPIDAGTIDGFVESTESALPTIGSIGIPSAFLGAQTVTFCSPMNLNYSVLYPAAPSPSALIVAVNASHTELELQSSCVDCALCSPMGTANPQVVLDDSVRYLTAFFARELLGDTSVGAAFQGAGGPADQAAGLVQISSK